MKNGIKTRFINKIMSRCNYCRESLSTRQMSKQEERIEWRCFVTGMGLCRSCWEKVEKD